MRTLLYATFAVSAGFLMPGSAHADSIFFNTGSPDGRMATASRPANGGKTEIESADDFVLAQTTRLTGGTFTGLLPINLSPGEIANVVVEIYRVFPLDSLNPPSGRVPTRVNSPSDAALDSRDSAAGELSFTTALLSTDFAAQNSVLSGINPVPNQTTGGEGQVRGQERMFSFTFTTPMTLDAGHYFFVPQVAVQGTGDFFWLSSARPIVAPGTPFAPDLQSWIRNDALAPDWLRIGTDIVGQGTFNAAFSLIGQTVPEPATWALMIAGFALAGAMVRRRPAQVTA